MVYSSDGALSEVPHPVVGAIVVAAGESRRMGDLDKIFVPLNGQPLISYCLEVLNDSDQVDKVVLVMSSHNAARGRELVEARGWSKVVEICVGGTRRQDSVRIGLERLQDCDMVIVQDGARPFIDAGLVATGIVEARNAGAAVAAVPVKDTIKAVGADMVVVETAPREGLWAVQTPQIFHRGLLAQAHERIAEDVTDDASMVERIGGKVRVFMGSFSNIKVTTPEDLPIAEAILKARAVSQYRGVG